MLLKVKGELPVRVSIILIEQGQYKGFGFVDAQESIAYFEDFSNYITRYKSTYYTTKILQAYHKKKQQ